MELLRKQTALIEKLVKANPKYIGNEDLLEDFCMETYQKSYFILQSIEDFNTLEIYLKKVVSSAIIDVLKINGRIVRSTNGYSSVKEILLPFEKPVEYVPKEDIQHSKQEPVPIEQEPFDYGIEKEEEETPFYDLDEVIKEEEVQEHSQTYKNQPRDISLDLVYIKDPRESIEEQVIRKDILENIVNLVKQINEAQPKEMYLKLFYSRYFMQMKQREIAQETGLSQSEISKRLVHLSRLIKEKLYQ